MASLWIDHVGVVCRYKHLADNLATYAMPAFLRLLPAMESTGTFKQRKVTFVKEGVDLDQVQDPIWFLDLSDRANPGCVFIIIDLAFGSLCW